MARGWDCKDLGIVDDTVHATRRNWGGRAHPHPTGRWSKDNHGRGCRTMRSKKSLEIQIS